MSSDPLYITAEKLLVKEQSIGFEEALELYNLDDSFLPGLVDLSERVTSKYHKKGVYLCSIISAKTGACPEDCGFCAQSIFNEPLYPHTPIIEPQKVLASAMLAERSGASEFCIVSSGRGPDTRTMRMVLEAARLIQENTDLSVGCSLGILTEHQAEELACAGVRRYNHNLETSRSYFPEICSTHSFDERLKTARHVRKSSMELCCGGIFGIGETPVHRIELAFELREVMPQVVPLNFLDPRPGTRLGLSKPLSVNEALKTICLFRLILPKSILLSGGGRETTFGDSQSHTLSAGINAMITGDYLTTKGAPTSNDREMINSMGLDILKFS